MIVVTVVIGDKEIIERVSVSGHAFGLEKGGNIVCAAVTILLRTAARLLENISGVEVSGGPAERGEYELRIGHVDISRRCYVKTVGEFLLQGIKDLGTEFPDDCMLEETQRRDHGT